MGVVAFDRQNAARMPLEAQARPALPVVRGRSCGHGGAAVLRPCIARSRTAIVVGSGAG